MPMPKNPSKDIFDYPARYQFGEKDAPCGGASCCTDTCIKMIVEYYKDKSYSLAQIRKAAQRDTNFDERPCTGLNGTEVLHALHNFGIDHYRIGTGVQVQDVWKKVEDGPVIVGVHYGSYPDRKDQVSWCGPKHAEHAGKTDCPFRGAHAVLVIGKRRHRLPKDDHRDFYVRDPDHNSPSRPETPKYDIIRRPHLKVAMNNLVPYTSFSNTYIVYPTQRKKIKK